ncbi:MAG: enoyl-CoA hydratase-related protein [Acidimicrobiia bacterium]
MTDPTAEPSVRHEVSADGAVHTITIDKPPGNVIDIAMCAELDEALTAAAAARGAKVLVLRGAGKNFSFGASVEEHLPDVAPPCSQRSAGSSVHWSVSPIPHWWGCRATVSAAGSNSCWAAAL